MTKKLLLTFLFCMIGFSVFSDEVFQCRTKTVDIKHDFGVRNFVDEKSVGMRIILDKDRIVISDLYALTDNKYSLFRITEKNDYLIEAVECSSGLRLSNDTCGWNSMDENLTKGKTKMFHKTTLTFFREQKVGTLFFTNNISGIGITKLICSQI